MVQRRYLRPQLVTDLSREMVFMAGPRQVGKTTLAKSLPESRKGYLDWDLAEHRERILRGKLPAHSLWVFDEIHRYRTWRAYLARLCDSKPEGQRILVTGSAKLDHDRYAGDSLQGRYRLLRLHPLSAAELAIESAEDLLQLFNLGGFPEPFFGGSEIEAQRWSRDHRNLIIREELTSLERVDDLGNLELLMLRLPELVGMPLSVNSLLEYLQRSHKTIENWIRILERLYVVYRLLPFGSPGLRATKKARKLYHFDWSVVPDPAARFENMVGSHLLKWVHFQQDTEGSDLELRYFRDSERRKVDFIVVHRGLPVLMVDCAWLETKPDRGLRYLKRRFPDCPAWQVSAIGDGDYISFDGIRVSPTLTFLSPFA